MGWPWLVRAWIVRPSHRLRQRRATWRHHAAAPLAEISMDQVDFPRFASRGRTYVYLLPCRDEDLLKIGFSRTPLERMQTLHRRYFELFDLKRGWLLETAQLREARKIERDILCALPEQRASPPLTVERAAGGYTEWHRGAYAEALALLRQAAQGSEYGLQPLDQWLRGYFRERADLLHDWANCMLEQIQYQTHNLPPECQQPAIARALRGTLAACLATGFEPWRWVSPATRQWYEAWDS